MPPVDLRGVEVLTFDCYGTLIDWESGLLAALRSVLAPRGVAPTDDELLEAYARHEAAEERGVYRPYREVLARSLRGLCRGWEVTPSDAEVEAFWRSVPDWPAFPDTASALALLAARFRLGVITNCDDDLFAGSRERLGVPFDWVITAEQVRSYKPSAGNFEVALERIGLPRERIVHVAQSLFHDHVPAKQLGLATVWIDRRAGRPGSGATPPASATPDYTFPDLRSFTDVALSRPSRGDRGR